MTNMTSTITWAQTAAAGEYLALYEDFGAPDPGSRCGLSDSELSRIKAVLASRDMRLEADDLGLRAVCDCI